MPSDHDIAVRVEGLGKRYLVPQKHQEDYSRAPSVGERLKEFFPAIMGADETDFFWALRDVSFEVRRGEVLGIVGENGSGKSTLLKILSGVTPPTEGSAELRGRVGSLLEVGTGFHPDLSGRENIFFNGSLLGLSVKEIRSKLDAIIDFSGIGDFIDVPVKRYSSGMYVRLAYSVAALLDSEILILDEVLAVGDDQFRAKTQDHIRQTTSVGKTILFVSHSPHAVASICDRGIVLEHGRVVFAGTAREVIAEYQARQFIFMPKLPTAQPSEENTKGTADQAAGDVDTDTYARQHFEPRARVNIANAGRLRQIGVAPPTGVLQWISVHKMDGELCARFKTFDGMKVRIGFSGVADPANTFFSVLIHNSDQDRMMTAHSTHIGHHLGVGSSGVVECVIPSLLIGDGVYSLMIDTGVYDFEANRLITQDCVPRATYIQVSVDGRIPGTGLDEFRGAAHLSQWTIVEQNADQEISASSAQGNRAPPSSAAE
jgi:lipopolysaccharide transport system ATP-binding protein